VERLVQLSPMNDPRVFLCLGGGDAIDTAAKLARQYWAAQGQAERIHLISRTYAYHGTHGFGTSLVGMESMRQGYGPLLGSVSHVDHESPEALEAEIERVGADTVAAFFCEPVIGAGGVRPAPPGYIEAVAAICKRHGVLLVIDSVICAFGRVGTWFGYERWNIEPDMIVLAKGITSGYLPLGGVVVSDAVAQPFWSTPGRAMFRHGATYAGHPTCCAAALANLDILDRENLIPRGRELEGELMDALAPLRDHPMCGEIRGGLGLAAAVDLTAEALQNVPAAMGVFSGAIRAAGVLLRPQATGVAIGPPLVVERSHLDEIAVAVRSGLDAVAAAA
jgi:adenosylmethionine-8-amino-7-oxononanoate aminotransferase